MQRDLHSYPIPPSYRTKLKAAGFSAISDVVELKPSELSKELGISKEDALELLRTFKSGRNSAEQHDQPVSSTTSCQAASSGTSTSGETPSQTGVCSTAWCNDKSQRTVTAFEMLRQDQSKPPIITFCEELDDMLGGGVPMGKITEICGAPGVGKTQLCIQLSVDAQIPVCLGGAGGEAIYIDTEGSFIPQRAWEIGQAAAEHCQRLLDAGSAADADELKAVTVEKILSGIHYFRCHNHVELLALVNLLPDFLSQHNAVKLIVVDSIAFHFRHDFDDMSLRTRLLNGLAQSLIRIATQNSLAVVLTNQMTTKIGDGTSHLVPALGESWGHACTIRLILYWKDAQRYANLYKSPSKREATIPYQITLAGVRSVGRSSSLCGTMQASSMGPTGESHVSTRQNENTEGVAANQHPVEDAGNPRKRPRQDNFVT
ncbi:DNA repair protein RAD51 homolog 3-like isoform X1 [Diadema setosum]|uniref:DNA repair protein RAD51 homolog 3-like isoform X1 n=1 Tax=Diadema setosum TaxID=31175 RepID=UPI003B3B0B49